jgi:hypothetical protein
MLTPMAAASAVPGIPAEDISRLKARPSDASADRRKLTTPSPTFANGLPAVPLGENLGFPTRTVISAKSRNFAFGLFFGRSGRPFAQNASLSLASTSLIAMKTNLRSAANSMLAPAYAAKAAS